MAFKYTEEQLNKLDKELLVQLFLGLQDQMEGLTRQTQALGKAVSGRCMITCIRCCTGIRSYRQMKHRSW